MVYNFQMVRERDTDIGGSRTAFPGTKLSVIAGLRHKEEQIRIRAWETLTNLYWKPVYKYIRIKWNKSNEDAKDLTQGFFARSMEKSFFDSYTPEKAKFRTFLRTCLDGFIANEQKAAQTKKRGGETSLISLDFPGAENELVGIPQTASPEQVFEKDWIRNLFHIALETLRTECENNGKKIYYLLFEKYDIDPEPNGAPSYKDLAAEFGISVADVTNYLAYARKEFRRIVLNKLREVTASEEEFRSDAQQILGFKIE
ncbi:MAG: hypothetical protein C5B54_09750 [Acidobacteria bacterium]|nr:MAG: hypothetical protein C5B54_09750 [Acidobacteriota bacterium]